MTGLKSGAGDDLWDDDTEDDADPGADESAEADDAPDAAGRSAESDGRPRDDGPDGTDDSSGGESGAETHPYIVRRAIQDKSVQFERDERLTFFVHDDVVDGERELLSELESALGRNVPKFDVREAVYRAALRNPDDVLDELLDMGYSLDEERE